MSRNDNRSEENGDPMCIMERAVEQDYRQMVLLANIYHHGICCKRLLIWNSPYLRPQGRRSR